MQSLQNEDLDIPNIFQKFKKCKNNVSWQMLYNRMFGTMVLRGILWQNFRLTRVDNGIAWDIVWIPIISGQNTNCFMPLTPIERCNNSTLFNSKTKFFITSHVSNFRPAERVVCACVNFSHNYGVPSTQVSYVFTTSHFNQNHDAWAF